MKTVCKISSTIVLEYTYNDYGSTQIISGVLTISQGRGRKKLVMKFIWNQSLDNYPVIRGRAYNANEIAQLKSMLEFYINLAKEVK